MERDKRELETVIRENTRWLMQFMMHRCGSWETAEDLVQEVWLLVYRNWDRYREDGRLSAWLKRIAQNVFLRYLRSRGTVVFLSMEAETEDSSLADILTDGITAEDQVMAAELSGVVRDALNRLPEGQQKAVICRFLWDMSIPEAAEFLQVTEGTVKSNTSRGLSAMRKYLEPERNMKGVMNMECRDAMQYLYVYAAGLPEMDKRAEVEEHLRGCPECRKMADALGKLIPQMMVVDEGCMSHWSIDFPEKKIGYGFIGFPTEHADWCNRKLAEWDGHIPEDYNWFGNGFNDIIEPGREFDNEGHEILFRVSYPQKGYCQQKITWMHKVYPYMRLYDCKWIKEGYWCKIENKEDGLYHGTMDNCFGQPVKTGQYQMIPKAAQNIRITQGNGVLDCGEYWAVYAERYTGENETIALKYTFTME